LWHKTGFLWASVRRFEAKRRLFFLVTKKSRLLMLLPPLAASLLGLMSAGKGVRVPMSISKTEITSNSIPENASDETMQEIGIADERTLKPGEHDLPDQPLVRIEAGKTWSALNLRDLWQYRELLYLLMWRDVKVRYKQTLLGVTWVIIQPLFTMFVFTLIFGRLAGVPSDNIPYPIFAFAGLLPWTFFSTAVVHSGNSMVNSAHLITKVYFPRVIIPTAAIGAHLLDFTVSFGLLALLMTYYQIRLTWSILILLPVVMLTALLALGMGLLMAALNVKYRDIPFSLPFVIQLWMFVSPIIYPASLLPGIWAKLLALNPLTGIIEGYRSALFGRPINWGALGISTGITILLLVYSSYSFRKMEKTFADII
jgi:lipopolysaccharide transport system permease protein